MLENIRPSWVLFWVIMVLVPVICMGILMTLLPGDASEVPLHWNAAGQIDRWGTPEEFWILPGIMSVLELVLGISFFKSDYLYSRGLTHGVDRPGVKKVLVISALLILITDVAVSVGIYLSVVSVVG